MSTPKRRVAVIEGGWSSERDVSLSSGAGMADALRSRGHDVIEIDAGRDLVRILAALDPRPDVVLNALHGKWGEDGCVQGLLEVLGLPYTHSGVRASAIAMDKPTAKKLFEAAGLTPARHLIVARADIARGRGLPIPYVAKPPDDGSSVHVRIIRTPGDERALLADWPSGAQRLMVETFVPGMELTVAVMGDRALEPIEITCGNRDFYDYDSKYAPGGSVHLIPARVAGGVRDRLKDQALRAHRALGCAGLSRADFRYDPHSDRLVILEVNTQPGMTPTSLVQDAAAHEGIGYADMVEWMVEDALCAR